MAGVYYQPAVHNIKLVPLMRGREGLALLRVILGFVWTVLSTVQHAQGSAVPYLSRATASQDFIPSSCQLNIFKSNKFIKIV